MGCLFSYFSSEQKAAYYLEAASHCNYTSSYHLWWRKCFVFFLAEVMYYLPSLPTYSKFGGYYILTANTPACIATEYNIQSLPALILLFTFKLVNKATSVNHLHIIPRIVSLVCFRWEDVLQDETLKHFSSCFQIHAFSYMNKLLV